MGQKITRVGTFTQTTTFVWFFPFICVYHYLPSFRYTGIVCHLSSPRFQFFCFLFFLFFCFCFFCFVFFCLIGRKADLGQARSKPHAIPDDNQGSCNCLFLALSVAIQPRIKFKLTRARVEALRR